MELSLHVYACRAVSARAAGCIFSQPGSHEDEEVSSAIHFDTPAPKADEVAQHCAACTSASKHAVSMPADPNDAHTGDRSPGTPAASASMSPTERLVAQCCASQKFVAKANRHIGEAAVEQLLAQFKSLLFLADQVIDRAVNRSTFQDDRAADREMHSRHVCCISISAAQAFGIEGTGCSTVPNADQDEADVLPGIDQGSIMRWAYLSSFARDQWDSMCPPPGLGTIPFNWQ